MEDDRPNIPVLKTYVYFEGKAFFVSTIWRTYDTCAGSSRGLETMAWEIDVKTLERDKWIYQGDGMGDHFKACRELASIGIIKEEE
jgi:hypothetical protein